MSLIGTGAILTMSFWGLTMIEPFCYYIPWTIGKFYKHHKDVKTKYNDVIGCDDLKKEISDTIKIFQADPSSHKFSFLFKGASGTGKTFMTQAIAGEFNLPFVEILSGQMRGEYVPIVVNTILKKHLPCIIFIDECHSLFGFNSEYMIRILDSMTACQSKVIFIFATNRDQEIESALTRKGRIDKIINFDAPNKNERSLHVKRAFPFLSNEECQLVTDKVGKISQADINFLKREYDFLQKQHELNSITGREYLEDIYSLIEKLHMGYHTQKIVVDQEQQYRIAIHEIGHAFTAFMMKNSVKPNKISLSSSGNLLGYNIINNTESSVYTQQELLAMICVYFSGYLAEKVFFDGNTSTLVTSDMQAIVNIFKIMSNSLMIRDDKTSEDTPLPNFTRRSNVAALVTADIKCPITSGITNIFLTKEQKRYLRCIEDFLMKNVFTIENQSGIKSLAQSLIEDQCWEGTVIDKLFESYRDKILKVDIDLD